MRFWLMLFVGEVLIAMDPLSFLTLGLAFGSGSVIAMASFYGVKHRAYVRACQSSDPRVFPQDMRGPIGVPPVLSAGSMTGHDARSQIVTAVFDQISDVVFLIEADTGKLCYMNEYALRMQGWSRAAVGHKTLMDTSYNPEKCMVDVMLDTVLAEGKASFTLHSDVSGKTCNAQCYAIASPDGKQRVLLIVRDISQQTDGERARKELLSVITHELRTPLTSSKGARELRKGGATGALSDQASSLVTIATANSERMLGLIRDILEMEEINQAGFEITPEHLNLSALVQSTLEAHSGYGAHLAVSFADAGTEPDLFTMTDPRRVSQVLSNLLSNAAKVTERGGTVELWARREGAEAAIYVRDYGPGIPEVLRDKLFERFAKSSEPNRSQVSGSGLGLSIVKTLVAKLGGTISFTTESGVGTTFRITLPLSAA